MDKLQFGMIEKYLEIMADIVTDLPSFVIFEIIWCQLIHPVVILYTAEFCLT